MPRKLKFQHRKKRARDARRLRVVQRMFMSRSVMCRLKYHPLHILNHLK